VEEELHDFLALGHMLGQLHSQPEVLLHMWMSESVAGQGGIESGLTSTTGFLT